MKRLAFLGFVGASVAVGGACASNDKMMIGSDCDSGFCSEPPPPAFEPPDAAAAPRELTNYCPSNKCPEGYTTCPTSTFLCDVDLRSDPNNCGACGAVCPGRNTDAEFRCIGGRCVIQCNDDYADCDGIIDNGCEVKLGSDPNNCRACGDTCDDGQPCVKIGRAPAQCGCPAGLAFCPGTATTSPTCADLREDDDHCTECGHACDPTGGPGAPPPPPNTHYGCSEGKCGQPECDDGYADCNSSAADGCETKLSTHENCTMCGDNCRAQGLSCVYTIFQGTACRCPLGTNFCGVDITEPFVGFCADFANDQFNCGGCGRVCPASATRSKGICSYGTCKLECFGRWADCDGDVDTDCEIDTYGDPNNCGGCGITCDVAAGQACAGGRCVVEPCTPEESR